jgi:GR25 family glycosyltransferase involved in LPS biosynthesis
MKKYILKKSESDIKYLFINVDNKVDRLNYLKKNLKYLFENNLINRISGKKSIDLHDNIIYNNILCKYNINIDSNRKLLIGELGCVISHIKCVLTALKNNYKYTVILEDDVIPICEDYHNKIKNIIINAPKDWSIIQIINMNPSIIYFLKKSNKLYNNKLCNCKKDCICIINALWGASAYIINQKYCKLFLETYYDKKNNIFDFTNNKYFLSDCILYHNENKIHTGYYQYKYSPFLINDNIKSTIVNYHENMNKQYNDHYKKQLL